MTDSTAGEGEETFSESVSVTEEETGDASRDSLPDTEAIPDATLQGQEKDSKPAAASKAEGKENDEPAAGDDSAAPEPDASTRRAKSSQTRINILTRKLRETEQETAYLRGRVDALEGNGKPAPASGTEAGKEGDSKPTIDDFDTAEEFADALADWKLTQREHEKPAARPEPQGSPASPPRDAPRQPTDAEAKSYLAASAKYEDLEEVLFDPDLPWTKHMADAVSEEEDAAELLYLLGKAPAELERIAKLSPKAQEREVWRFVDKTRAGRAETSQAPAKQDDEAGKPDATLRAKAQPGPQVSKAAPVPSQTLSGSASAGSRRLEDLSDEEYIDEMNRRESARQRRA